MSAPYFVTVRCPVGDEELTIEVRQTSRGSYGSYDSPPEGPEFDWDPASVCPRCAVTFTEEQEAELAQRIEDETYNWYDNHKGTAPWDEEPDGPEPDYDLDDVDPIPDWEDDTL